jgi:hypothetical protein
MLLNFPANRCRRCKEVLARCETPLADKAWLATGRNRCLATRAAMLDLILELGTCPMQSFGLKSAAQRLRYWMQSVRFPALQSCGGKFGQASVFSQFFLHTKCL